MIENYTKLSHGHWYQETLTGPIMNYNETYSKSRYDTYDTNDVMSNLRYDLISNTIGEFDSICDFGYGNGAFIKKCLFEGHRVYGYDISDYPVPEGSEKLGSINEQHFDIITFFDSLEHLQEKYLTIFLKNLDTKHVCISVPWFHESQGSNWFLNWKHRRENEHLHHFDSSGLINLLLQSGYSIRHVGNNEDKVRTPTTDLPNILTVIATKK
jgi:hypothetical protein